MRRLRARIPALLLCALLTAPGGFAAAQADAGGLPATLGTGRRAEAPTRREGTLTRDADVRESPGGAVLARLPAGTQIAVCAMGQGWFEVEYRLRRGYVDRGCLALDGDATPGLTGRTLYAVTHATFTPSAGGEPQALKPGDRVLLFGIDKDQARVGFEGRAGSVPADALAMDEERCYRLNVPGDSIEDLQLRLEALGYYDGRPTGIFDAQTAEAVVRFRAEAGFGDAFALDDAVNARLYAADAPPCPLTVSMLQMGDKSDAVARLQARLAARGYLKDPAPGRYDSLTAQAVMLYQSVERLPETGAADRVTLRRLFSREARALPAGSLAATPENAPRLPGGVRNVDWFEGDVARVFAIGTVATVTDVPTGISWQIMRCGGYNHADVQPLTAGDTELFRQAAGGTWTWMRRPIWVTIGAIRYAASMNCMPHGNGVIKDNAFPGHHCVHFLNSRTHGTNRIDDRHQLCVSVATASLSHQPAALAAWTEMVNTYYTNEPDEAEQLAEAAPVQGGAYP